MKPSEDAVLIKHVRAFVFGDDKQEKESGGGADCHKQSEGHWIVDSDIANPMSVYEQYRKSRTSWGIDAMGSVVVEVELSNGMVGVGISIGGDAACYIVEKHLARFVEGQDPANVELIWDQCWRSTMNYGRKGIAIQVSQLMDSLCEEGYLTHRTYALLLSFDCDQTRRRSVHWIWLFGMPWVILEAFLSMHCWVARQRKRCQSMQQPQGKQE